MTHAYRVMPVRIRVPAIRFEAATVIFLLGILLCAVTYQRSLPVFIGGEFDAPGKESEALFLPLRADAFTEQAEIEATFFLPARHPTRLRILADDCLEALWVNGQRVEMEQSVPCTPSGETLALRPYLKEGENTLIAHVRNRSGSLLFTIGASPTDPWLLLIAACAFALTFFYGLRVLKQWKLTKWNGLYTVLAIGAALGAFHVLATPFWIRVYDLAGHLDYISHVFNHWSIPQANDGWEFFQPPLYYFLAALWLRGWHILGTNPLFFETALQLLSWLIFLGSLACMGRIAVQLFGNKEEKMSVMLFAALLATFPGLLYFSYRISNDTLFLAVSLLFCVYLFKWWKSRKDVDWFTAVAVLGVAILTKSTALPLVIVGAFCLIAQRGIARPRKKKLAHSAFLLLFAITGWLFVLRFIIQGETHIVGNTPNDIWLVENSFAHLFGFRPIHILTMPFNHTIDDTAGRQYLWDFFFRSSFFGGWVFDRSLLVPALMMLQGGLLMLPLMGWGFYKALKDESPYFIPCATLLFVSLTSLLLFRATLTYSCNQDFRFIPLVAIPCAYFIVVGIQKSTGIVKDILIPLTMLFIGLCALWPVLLLWGNI